MTGHSLTRTAELRLGKQVQRTGDIPPVLAATARRQCVLPDEALDAHEQATWDARAPANGPGSLCSVGAFG